MRAFWPHFVVFSIVAWGAIAAPRPAGPVDADTRTIIAADGAMKRGAHASAIGMLQPLAKQGDARAQSGLGTIYFTAPPPIRNYRTGAYWFKLTADQGDAFAQHIVGGEYDSGRGFSESPSDAVK